MSKITSNDKSYSPSRFWQKLSESHLADLEKSGFENIKRKQALRYFNWQWKWSAIRESQQMKFLLKNNSLKTKLLCALTPGPLSSSAWNHVPWGILDRWLYVFSIRLLWEFASRNDRLGILELEEPKLGNPLPVHWRGRLISQDLANSVLEMNWLLSHAGDFEPTSIIEIGAGYGRNAYILLSIFPEAEYTIVDIEPALSISKQYLAQLFPNRKINFVHPTAVDTLPDNSRTLGISISSLHEMTKDQIRGYINLFDRLISKGFIYIKQWEEWKNPDDDITVKFDDYDFPSNWNLVKKETAPVQTNFIQAVWGQQD